MPEVVHQRHLHREAVLDVNGRLAGRRADGARRRQAPLPCRDVTPAEDGSWLSVAGASCAACASQSAGTPSEGLKTLTPWLLLHWHTSHCMAAGDCVSVRVDAEVRCTYVEVHNHGRTALPYRVVRQDLAQCALP